MAFLARASHSLTVPFPAIYSMFAAISMQISVRSSGPSPLRVSTASMTSKLFPMAFPRGTSISVISAITFLPAKCPISTIDFASLVLSSKVFIKPPEPVFTSNSMQSAPAASFLPIMLDTISGKLSTVAVTSRSA